MTQLQARKNLLVAESGLIRSRLLNDRQKLGQGTNRLLDRARLMQSLASSLGAIVSSSKSRSETKAKEEGEDHVSWLQIVADGTRLVSNIWFKCDHRSDDLADK